MVKFIDEYGGVIFGIIVCILILLWALKTSDMFYNV